MRKTQSSRKEENKRRRRANERGEAGQRKPARQKTGDKDGDRRRAKQSESVSVPASVEPRDPSSLRGPPAPQGNKRETGIRNSSDISYVILPRVGLADYCGSLLSLIGTNILTTWRVQAVYLANTAWRSREKNKMLRPAL